MYKRNSGAQKSCIQDSHTIYTENQKIANSAIIFLLCIVKDTFLKLLVLLSWVFCDIHV